MTAIGPGDLVELFRLPDENFPLHSVWRVERVYLPLPGTYSGCEGCSPLSGSFGLDFHNGPEAGNGSGWCSCAFRPFNPPKDESITKFLTQPILEDA